MAKQKDPLVANYELNSYSYTGFWEGRQYEDKAERVAIQRLIPRTREKWFIDLGGSYGRLLDEYAIRAENIIVVDYATNDLPLSRERANKLGIAKFHLVAANVYKLPFRDNSIGGGIMVRVMHHLQQPELFFDELARVLRPGGYFILEFANQYHLKAVLVHLITGRWSFFFKTPYQLPHRQDSQGINQGQVSLIFNFAPGSLRKMLRAKGLKVEGERAVSWLRWGFFKRILPLTGMLRLERFLQRFFSWTHLAPSVFWLIRKPANDALATPQVSEITDLLVDPVSKGKLSHTTRFNQIWDLRDPKPEDITY